MVLLEEDKVKYFEELANPKQFKKRRRKRILKRILKYILTLFVLGTISIIFLLYGPISKFRVWLVTSAMTTMNHQYFATWFYSEETINKILENNKVIEINENTNPDLIVVGTNAKNVNYANEFERAVLENSNNEPYKIIEIKGDSYTGYLGVVYDASNIKAAVTSKLGISGQYVTKMAENNNAILSINGGSFTDPNYSSTGGQPQGITIVDGKLITNTRRFICWIINRI